MLEWFKQLDQILRGSATQMSELRDGRVNIALGGLSTVVRAVHRIVVRLVVQL